MAPGNDKYQKLYKLCEQTHRSIWPTEVFADLRVIGSVLTLRSTAASGAALPRIMSEALSAIIRVEALRLAEIIRGKIEASIARRLCADELSRARSHLTTVMSPHQGHAMRAALSRMN